MLDLAIKRFKNHQILISKEVKAYILKAKMENYSNNSSDLENYGEEDSMSSNSDINSLNSDRLEEEFQKVMDTQSDNELGTQRSTNNLEGQSNGLTS
jgi:hypothetical protein